MSSPKEKEIWGFIPRQNYGLISEFITIAFSMKVPLLAYVFITYYGLAGSRFRAEESDAEEIL